MADVEKYNEMFEYLRDPVPPTSPEGIFVFGRRDERLAQKMGELSTAGLAEYFMVAGGWGKDSGSGWDTRESESDFVIGRAQINEPTYKETTCLTGWDGARLGLREIRRRKLPHDEVTVMAHATSARRLSATTERAAQDADMPIRQLHRIPTDYPFDPHNERDQFEAAGEMLRLADWPERGILTAQPDLPEELVEFARDQVETPKIPSLLVMAFVRKLPFTIRRAQFRHAVHQSTV